MNDTPALELVRTMIAGWEALDADAVAACFAEDGVWHNMPYPPIIGRAAIAASIGRFIDTATEVRFAVHHIAEITEGVVITERNDIFRQKDGRTLDIPVMGIFEITDRKITAWRDYFDGGAMNG